jgi:hypothetical protein
LPRKIHSVIGSLRGRIRAAISKITAGRTPFRALPDGSADCGLASFGLCLFMVQRMLVFGDARTSAQRGT